uniref:Sialate O-acetylesterase domain-containing protein n=1 Tax=Kalanchoe fedtschenkoi TaxID=63787 RepID=A0A7N0TNR7_KALFE
MELAGSTPTTADAPRKDIFILSGQSNMAGRGGVLLHSHPRKWDGVVPPECAPSPNILRLSAHLRWEVSNEPLHRDIDSRKVCGVGPGMAFANAVHNSGSCGGSIGLVPCAVGGTAIREWARGEHLYQNMVRRAKEAVKHGSGEIRALLWYQGESDTYTQDEVDAYRMKMESLIGNVREDLALPSLPIIQMQIISASEISSSKFSIFNLIFR